MAYTSPHSPSAGRGRKPVIAIASVVGAVAAAGIAVVLILGFTSSPAETVEEFIERHNAGEHAEALELASQQYAADFRDKEWDGRSHPPQDWVDDTHWRNIDVRDVQEEGDKAIVLVEESLDNGNSKEASVLLKWQDGQWLIQADMNGSRDL